MIIIGWRWLVRGRKRRMDEEERKREVFESPRFPPLLGIFISLLLCRLPLDSATPTPTTVLLSLRLLLSDSPIILISIFSPMALWKDAGLSVLRHAVAGEHACRSQSARFLSSSSRVPRVSRSNRTPMITGKTVFPRKQQHWNQAGTSRSFSAATRMQHGHITPPKPGEE